MIDNAYGDSRRGKVRRYCDKDGQQQWAQPQWFFMKSQKAEQQREKIIVNKIKHDNIGSEAPYKATQQRKSRGGYHAARYAESIAKTQQKNGNEFHSRDIAENKLKHEEQRSHHRASREFFRRHGLSIRRERDNIEFSLNQRSTRDSVCGGGKGSAFVLVSSPGSIGICDSFIFSEGGIKSE